jgi:hypothetical protein
MIYFIAPTTRYGRETGGFERSIGVQEPVQEHRSLGSLQLGRKANYGKLLFTEYTDR